MGMYIVLVVALLGVTGIDIMTTYIIKPWPTRLGLAGLRAASAQLLHFLSLHLLIESEGVLNDSFNLRSSPGWRGLEHLNVDREIVMQVFGNFTEYLRHLHDLSRFGEVVEIGDEILDPAIVYDTFGIKNVHDTLFSPSACFMSN